VESLFHKYGCLNMQTYTVIVSHTKVALSIDHSNELYDCGTSFLETLFINAVSKAVQVFIQSYDNLILIDQQ
jgi:hypothetical protein